MGNVHRVADKRMPATGIMVEGTSIRQFVEDFLSTVHPAERSGG